MQEYEQHSISRRSFLKASGLAGAAGLLAACGGSGSGISSGAAGSAGGAAAEPLSEYITYEAANREIESWNFLYSQMTTDANVLTNLWDGLISFDCYGKAAPAIAESWEHDDTTAVWTFHLRSDVDWCDVNGEVKAHLTSKDFLVGLEWVLNAYKNENNSTSMPIELLAGAEAYNTYTKALGDKAAELTYEDMLSVTGAEMTAAIPELLANLTFADGTTEEEKEAKRQSTQANAEALFGAFEGVGIAAPDDSTIVYPCISACPYFDTVAAYSSFYPASAELIDELGIEGFRGMDYSTMWYNGPYIVEEYIQGNTKRYIPNPNYYAAGEASRFENFTVTILSDGSVGMQLYENRELDEIELGESTMTSITSNPDNEYNDYLCEKRPSGSCYQFHFNYQRLNEDGTEDENWNKAIANTAFRQCWFRGLDLTSYYTLYNMINPLKCEADTYTVPGLCYTSSGADYTSLVTKELGLDSAGYNGETMVRLRGQDITALKKQAIEELTALGVTFPVHAHYYILAGNTAAKDSADVLAQCFSSSFGDDFIVLDIGTYVSSPTKEVRTPKLHSFMITGWTADYGDPFNFLTQETLHNSNALFALRYSNISGIVSAGAADWQSDLVARYEEFTSLVDEASAIVDDMDARYAAFAKAEANLLESALVCPCYILVRWCLTHSNEYSKINARYGPCNSKAINWETTSAELGYSTKEYEAFAAAFEAATKA